MTQKEAVRKYVKEHGSITSMEAFQELGITRLAARIADLIADGYSVKKTSVQYTTPLGTKVMITQYSDIRKKRKVRL